MESKELMIFIILFCEFIAIFVLGFYTGKGITERDYKILFNDCADVANNEFKIIQKCAQVMNITLPGNVSITKFEVK